MSDTLEMPNLELKSYDAFVKADQSGKTSDFEAVVAVNDIPDKINDVMRAGAFKATLQDFADRGRSIPVVWSHDYRNIESYIGTVTKAEELAPGDSRLPPEIKEYGGLWVAGFFDDDPISQKAYNMLKGGRVNEWSFGYTIDKTAEITHQGVKYRELLEVSLWEVGPTIRGLHPNARTTQVKSRIPQVNADSTPDAKSASPVNELDLALASARLKLLEL